MPRSSTSISSPKPKTILKTSSICGNTFMPIKPTLKLGCSPKTTKLGLSPKNSPNSPNKEPLLQSISFLSSMTASSAKILMKSKTSKNHPSSPATSSKSSSRKFKRLLTKAHSSNKANWLERSKSYSAMSHN